jgi:trehalose 6-phosphate synthase/phosphatase
MKRPARLLIVSNRLPVSIAVRENGVELVRSTGGLATGLRGPHERSGGLWIGWPGDAGTLDEAARRALDGRLADLRTVPVWLDAEEVQRFYEGFSNALLWPLFHYRIDHMPLHVEDWDAYERVNQRFAETVAAHHRRGDVVWVHDYQLMRVPHLLRRLVPEARIGFFLHIPFPSSEVFRTLPFREPLLEGLLGADLVGFHTPGYMRHFASSLLRTFGLAADIDRVRVGEREVAFGAFPMGIDAAAVAALAAEPATGAEVAALRGDDRCAVLVGIDRLDYTKGVPRRLLAFEQLLRDRPALRERVRLIQVAVPSRTNVEAYQEFRQQVEGLVGHVNGAFGTPGWTPISYLYRSLSAREVVALYRAADVMVVTPVRDGMNLVAKEFVAARTDEDGVLVLSEFAGAASELAEALHVNPYDVGRTAEALHRALTLSPGERATRMRGLRRRVLGYDVHRWTRAFLDTLAEVSARREPAALALTPAREVDAVVRRMAAAPRLLLLLDYDGTLVPYASVPELAAPDAELLRLLGALAARPGTIVHVVSGRPRESIEAWLGALPIGLHAEHGFWSRDAAAAAWTSPPTPTVRWRRRVHAILEHFTEHTPGSLIEEKTASLAWHYRMAEPEFGERQANELRVHLTELLSNAPVEILTGAKVVEIRPYGVSKGVVAARLAAAAPDATVAAFGDDRTDEELFAALSEGGIAIHVGPQPSSAPIRLASVDDARALLAALLR